MKNPKLLLQTVIFATAIALLSNVILADYAAANPFAPLSLPKITIEANGKVNPQTDLISQSGNIYTLTGDITENAIVIFCSNIVFEGGGHTINVTKPARINPEYNYPEAYDDPAINIVDASNVIVKNVKAHSFNTNTINLQRSHDCKIIGVTARYNVRIFGDSNTVTRSNMGIYVYSGSSNLITENNVTHLCVGPDCYNNKFTRNNFFLTDYPAIMSDAQWNDSRMGNYWSNYTTKCPNAVAVGNTGIGDKPYLIERDRYAQKHYPVSCTDYRPLMYPWGPAQITVQPTNVTYPQPCTLSVTVNKPTRWLAYSLNGAVNTSFTGNFTLNNLTPGSYKIVVYATDVYGVKGASETAWFNIAQDVPFPPALVISAILAAVLIPVCVGLLMYFHKGSCAKKR